MRMEKKLSYLIAVLVMVLLPLVASGAEPTITLNPKRPGPGDIMVVTLRNISSTVTGTAVLGTFLKKPVYFNRTNNAWEAIVGIDLFTKPGTYPLSLDISGKRISRTVKIVKKKYPLERLTLPEDMVVLSPENEARVEREQKRMAVLWPVDSLRVWNGSFIDPLPDKKIGTPFGVRRIINHIPKSPHTGIDVRADEGNPVLAPNDAVVVLVDDEFYSGNSVVLDHGQGIYTMFFHLSKINVKYGQAVMKGDTIGLVGQTGRATGPHLHWGVRIQGARVDPLKLIHLKLE